MKNKETVSFTSSPQVVCIVPLMKLKISKAGWDICGLDKEACKRGPHETALTLPLDLSHKQWLAQDRTTCSGGVFLIFFFFFLPPHCAHGTHAGTTRSFNTFLMILAKNPLHKSSGRRNF